MTLVKIYYGPYLLHGIIRHRPQKLRGLLMKLSQLNYESEVIEVDLLNRLSIEMRSRQIYVCDIRYLKFNMECEDDEACQRVIRAIQDAAYRMAKLVDENRSDNIMWAVDYEYGEAENEAANTRDITENTERETENTKGTTDSTEQEAESTKGTTDSAEREAGSTESTEQEARSTDWDFESMIDDHEGATENEEGQPGVEVMKDGAGWMEEEDTIDLENYGE